jgi:CBS domain-containing protein
MRASELMTENPQCVTPDTTLTDVARKMRELNVGIIPVVDDMQTRRLQGVITDRDIAVRAVADGKEGSTRVSECMTTDVETVNKNDSVREVLNVMERDQVRRVPVTDREGRLVGIIAQADLAVDFAGDDPRREEMVEETIQRISEPARPRRSGMAAQGRGNQQTNSESER